MISAAYKPHGLTPHLGSIAWDFCIDENSIPVLIEANYNGNGVWFPQVVNGEPLFGKNTKKVLEFLRDRRRKIA